ncbi:MAG: hypothetical protein CFE28_09330 [Alphaproteobacteria bacterium PA2]|nr:MAG: hypothetical protein CFE28_09330 [Alphaproteobacteria bacterium PA2]
MTLNDAIASLRGKTDLTADDALLMRRAVFAGDVAIDREEADALFELNAGAGTLAREWRDFFAEAITDFVVRQQAPAGYVNETQAGWLIEACSRHGRLREDELDALVHVLEAADHCPQQLQDFVLSSLRSLALWRLHNHRRLTASDIARLKRLLFATGGAGDIGVTRAEAEALLDINDALGDARVEGDWRALFVSAVANSVLFRSTWSPVAERAAQNEAWAQDIEINPMKRLGDMRSAMDGVRDGFAALATWNFDNKAWADQVEAKAGLMAEAEAVTEDEASWLFDRLGRNGRFDENERALVEFIRKNAGATGPGFQVRLNQLGALGGS